MRAEQRGSHTDLEPNQKSVITSPCFFNVSQVKVGTGQESLEHIHLVLMRNRVIPAPLIS